MAAENNLLFSAAKKPAAENKLFSAANGLFSAAAGRQKNPTENKALFSAARTRPPKIAYFRRLAPWPPKLLLPKIIYLFSAAREAAENY